MNMQTLRWLSGSRIIRGEKWKIHNKFPRVASSALPRMSFTAVLDSPGSDGDVALVLLRQRDEDSGRRSFECRAPHVCVCVRGMFACMAVQTCRVTMLIHPTACVRACVCRKWDISSSGVVHAGSDVAVWLAASHWEKKKKKKDRLLCNQGHRTFIVPSLLLFIYLFLDLFLKSAALICRSSHSSAEACGRRPRWLGTCLFRSTHVPACWLKSIWKKVFGHPHASLIYCILQWEGP